MARTLAVDPPRRIDLGLGAVDRGVGGGIDDDGGTMRLDGAPNGIRITDIQLRAGQAYRRHARRDARQQASAHLALRAGDQHLQG